MTAPANSFGVVRVGDVVTGDAALPGGVTVLAITPSPDGTTPDSLQLSANVTAAITAATLTFTGAAVTDPLVVTKASYTVAAQQVRVKIEVFVFDGSTEGAAIDLTGLSPTQTIDLSPVDYDRFLLNQRKGRPA